jgi:hypothetical protein
MTSLYTLVLERKWKPASARLDSLSAAAAAAEVAHATRGGTAFQLAIVHCAPLKLLQRMVRVTDLVTPASPVAGAPSRNLYLPLHYAVVYVPEQLETIKLLIREHPLALLDNRTSPLKLCDVSSPHGERANSLLRSCADALRSREFGSLAALVAGDPASLRSRCRRFLTQHRLNSETVRFTVLLCAHFATIAEAPTKKLRRSTSKRVNFRRAARTLDKNCWSSIVTFL